MSNADLCDVHVMSKTIAAMLGDAAAAPQDMEALLFGRELQGCIVVESCLLTGGPYSLCEPKAMDLTQKSQALVARKKKLDQKTLGWCTMWPAGEAEGRRPNHRERCMHVAVQNAIGSDGVIGCMVLQNTKPSKLKEFCVDTLWVVGPELKPLKVHVRNVGTTAGSGSWMQPLPTSPHKDFSALRSSCSQVTENIEGIARDTLAASITSSAIVREHTKELKTWQRRTRELKMEQHQFFVAKLHALEEHQRVLQQQQQQPAAASR